MSSRVVSDRGENANGASRGVAVVARWQPEGSSGDGGGSKGNLRSNGVALVALAQYAGMVREAWSRSWLAGVAWKDYVLPERCFFLISGWAVGD